MSRRKNERFEGPLVLFPAIDLRRGRCVRLYQGRPDQETVFSDDPVAMANHWADEGASWLHVVNLDGAFGEESGSLVAARHIAEAMNARGVKMQFGGGLRTMADIDTALGWGITRIILGTVALRNPSIVREAIEAYGTDRVVIGIDARDGRVAVEGWQETSEVDTLELAEKMKELGVERVVYTDISRDGTNQGPNITMTGELAQKSGLRVIASGGVGSLEHLRQIRWIEPFGVEGVIVGRALYDRKFTLTEAQEVLEDRPPSGVEV